MSNAPSLFAKAPRPAEAKAVWSYLKENARGLSNAKHAPEIVSAVDLSGERRLRKCTNYISEKLMGHGEPVLCSHSRRGYYIAITEEEKKLSLKNCKRFTLSMLARWKRQDESLSIEQLREELLLFESTGKGRG